VNLLSHICLLSYDNTSINRHVQEFVTHLWKLHSKIYNVNGCHLYTVTYCTPLTTCWFYFTDEKHDLYGPIMTRAANFHTTKNCILHSIILHIPWRGYIQWTKSLDVIKVENITKKIFKTNEILNRDFSTNFCLNMHLWRQSMDTTHNRPIDAIMVHINTDVTRFYLEY